MSLTTRNPVRLAGANVNSGHPNTGELAFTRGGMTSFTAWSGGPLQLGSGSAVPVAQTADHAILISGPGRLNSAFVVNGVLSMSGVGVSFYDAASVAASGPGTIPAAGRTVLGVLNAPGGVSGQINLPGDVRAFDMPFNLGLAVNAPSGACGFSVSYTRETNPTNPAN